MTDVSHGRLLASEAQLDELDAAARAHLDDRIVNGQIREMTDYIDTELITRALLGTPAAQQPDPS